MLVYNLSHFLLFFESVFWGTPRYRMIASLLLHGMKLGAGEQAWWTESSPESWKSLDSAVQIDVSILSTNTGRMASGDRRPSGTSWVSLPGIWSSKQTGYQARANIQCCPLTSACMATVTQRHACRAYILYICILHIYITHIHHTQTYRWNMKQKCHLFFFPESFLNLMIVLVHQLALQNACLKHLL